MRESVFRKLRACAATGVLVMTLSAAAPAKAGLIPCIDPCCVGWAALAVVPIIAFLPPVIPDPPPRPPVCPVDTGSVSLTVQPAATEVKTGNSFEVMIRADISQPIVSYGFSLAFDQTLLSLDSITVPSTFTAMPPPDSTSVAALAFPTPAVGDDVLLATVRFTAKAVGQSPINVTIDPNNPLLGFAQEICGFATTSVAPGAVNITKSPPRPDPPIPEPATVLIMMAGAGFLWRRSRRG